MEELDVTFNKLLGGKLEVFLKLPVSLLEPAASLFKATDDTVIKICIQQSQTGAEGRFKGSA